MLIPLARLQHSSQFSIISHVMKKLEFIFGILSILALLLSLFLVPGANMAMVLGFGVLSVFYMYASFALFNGVSGRAIFKKESYFGIPRIRLIGAALTGIALSVCAIGILFKMMSWPGANNNLGMGLVAVFIALIVGITRYSKSKDAFYIRLFKRIVVYGGLALVLFILPSEVWIDFKYRNHPAYREALKNATADPSNQELWEKVHEEQLKMDQED